MRWRRSAALCGLLATAAFVPAVAEAAGDPDVTVTANGNALTGGLSFSPGHVTVNAGEEVAWTNTDFIAPHTVTDENGAFNLTGDWPPVFGALFKPFIGPLLGPGFGPAETRSYEFNTPGTFKYFCEVHPAQMRGAVTVVSLLPPPVPQSQTPTENSTLGAQSKGKKKKKKRKKRRKRGAR